MQVGSKNAAFFMGHSIKVSTRREDEPWVHELHLAAGELEERYRRCAQASGRWRGGGAWHVAPPTEHQLQSPLHWSHRWGHYAACTLSCTPFLSCSMKCGCRQEPVYRGDMVHRNPGDASTLSPMEHPFSVTRSWVASEAGAGAGTGEGEGDGAVGGEANDGLGRSFTRVLIGDLKPDIMELIMGEEAGSRICQQLAHLYHFYLHGAAGNRHADGAGAATGTLPNGEALPEIVVRYMQDARVVWSRSLAEVSGGGGCWGANGCCQGGGRRRCCVVADRDWK